MSINKNISVFLLMFVMLFAVLEIIFFVKRNEDFESIGKQRSESQITFLGTSYVALGIDDTQPGIYNAAAHSEPYLFTLKKIQLLKPSVAIVGLNPQNLQSSYERSVNNGLMTVRQFEYLDQYLTEEESADLLSCMDIESYSFYKFRKWIPFLGSRLSEKEGNLLFGGWDNREAISKLDSFTTSKRFHEEFRNGRHELSDFQLKYLFRIAEYCRQENIPLFFVTMPAHPSIRKRIPEKAYESFGQTVASLQMQYSTRYYNFFDNLYPDSFYFDADHLNGKGATVFTSLFIKRLKEDGVWNSKPKASTNVSMLLQK